MGRAGALFAPAKKEPETRRTLKDSFVNEIEYVTYRQEKDEELLKFLVLFFLTSTASVSTEAFLVIRLTYVRRYELASQTL